MVTCYGSNKKLEHRACSKRKKSKVKPALTGPHKSGTPGCGPSEQTMSVVITEGVELHA